MNEELGSSEEAPKEAGRDPLEPGQEAAPEQEVAPGPVDSVASDAEAEAEPLDNAPADLESRIREIGERLFAALTKDGRLSAASSFLGGRAMQRRILSRAVEDPRSLVTAQELASGLREAGARGRAGRAR